MANIQDKESNAKKFFLYGWLFSGAILLTCYIAFSIKNNLPIPTDDITRYIYFGVFAILSLPLAALITCACKILEFGYKTYKNYDNDLFDAIVDGFSETFSLKNAKENNSSSIENKYTC